MTIKKSVDNQAIDLASAKKSLQALPAYYGGKRKLIHHIFEHIPASGKLVDPMGGSMVIPLVAKRLGYDVVANDRSEIAFYTGKALLDNNDVLIDTSRLQEMLTPQTSVTFIADTYGDVQLPKQLAKNADGIRNFINNLPEKKQAPYMLLLIRYLTYTAPYNQFRYPGLVKGFLNNTYPQSMKKHIERWNTLIKDSLPLLQKLALQINDAICDGSASTTKQDVFNFLSTVKGDILYLDPPYAGAGVTYEDGYQVINNMLSQKVFKREESVFNDEDNERDYLMEMLAYSHRFGTTVFSYWNELHDHKWFEELFTEVKLNFQLIDIGPYHYTLSTKVGKKGEWKAAKDKGDREILYILKPKKTAAK